jgi:hypothetical protein
MNKIVVYMNFPISYYGCCCFLHTYKEESKIIWFIGMAFGNERLKATATVQQRMIKAQHVGKKNISSKVH